MKKKNDVSQDTDKKGQRVIKDMRCTSSLAARGMRSHRTNTIQKEVVYNEGIKERMNLTCIRGA